MEASDLPKDLTFHQEWQRIVFMPNGERVERLDSGWWADETIARSLLNGEYPDPTPTSWYMRLQTRWVSEHRTVEEPLKTPATYRDRADFANPD